MDRKKVLPGAQPSLHFPADGIFAGGLFPDYRSDWVLANQESYPEKDDHNCSKES
jgi:hypothetical protein